MHSICITTHSMLNRFGVAVSVMVHVRNWERYFSFFFVFSFLPQFPLLNKQGFLMRLLQCNSLFHKHIWIRTHRYTFRNVRNPFLLKYCLAGYFMHRHTQFVSVHSVSLKEPFLSSHTCVS